MTVKGTRYFGGGWVMELLSILIVVVLHESIYMLNSENQKRQFYSMCVYKKQACLLYVNLKIKFKKKEKREKGKQL